MSAEPIGVVRRIEAGRERALASNPHLSAYARAAITGRPQRLPEPKTHWVTVCCRTGEKSILEAAPAPAIAVETPTMPRRADPPTEREPFWETDLGRQEGFKQKRRSQAHPLPKWSVTDIIAAVARVTGLKPAQITGPEKHRRFVHPRHLAILIASRSRMDLSLPQISWHFGRRDHTTLCFAIQRADYRLSVPDSPDFRWYKEALAILGGES